MRKTVVTLAVFLATLAWSTARHPVYAQHETAADLLDGERAFKQTCANCHTPKGPTGDVADKALSGFLHFDEPPFKVTASNITQDKETGIGNWTDEQIKTVLRKGIKPNGVPVAMV